jgi:hypothetical protein
MRTSMKKRSFSSNKIKAGHFPNAAFAPRGGGWECRKPRVHRIISPAGT